MQFGTMIFQLPQNTIFYLLEKSMKRYRKLAQKKVDETDYNISINQLILLLNLQERPKLSQVELAELVFKDFASVARMVDLLVKKGYLKRIESSVDRRKKDLILTSTCEAMLSVLRPVVEEYRVLALGDFSEEDIKKIQSFLRQLIDNCETHL